MPPALPPLLSTISTSVIAAILFGLALGYITFYLTFNSANLVCVQYTTLEACNAPSFAGCVWTNAWGAQPHSSSAATDVVASCKYGDYTQVYCPQYNVDTCAAASSSCVYNFGKGACEHAVGLTDAETGLFAASITIGNVFGSIAVAYLMHYFSFRTSWLGMVSIMTLGTVLHNISRAANSFPLLIFARIVLGFGTNGTRYMASVYAFATTPAHGAAVTGTLIAVSESAGLASALYTYFAMPKSFDVDPHFEALIHGWHGMVYFMCAVAAVVGIFMHRPDPVVGTDGVERAAPLPDEGLLLPVLRHPFEAFIGLVLCCVYLFSGYVAILSLMPIYSKDVMNVEPALSVLVIAIIAAGSGMIAVAIRSFVSNGRPLAVGGSFIVGTFTVLLGVFSYPGNVTTATTRYGLAIACIVGLFAALEMCVGNTFFGLALEMQPPHIRTSGGAFISTVVGLFAIIVNSCFPTVATQLSGGAGGNQLKGFSIIMIFLGCIAIVCGGILARFLRVYPVTTNDEDSSANQEAGDVDEMKLADAKVLNVDNASSATGSLQPTPEHDGIIAVRMTARNPLAFPDEPGSKTLDASTV